MPRFKMSDGQRIQFTAEEETARDIEEQAWSDDAVNRAFRQLRADRNSLLAKTDFYALPDVTMSEAMTTYRQALRDVPSGLSTVEDINTAHTDMLENRNPVKP